MNNNPKPEGEVKKECPFNGKLCGDWCPLFTQLMQNVNGAISETNVCTFVATNAILSDINMKAGQLQRKQAPQIHLPGNLRGN